MALTPSAVTYADVLRYLADNPGADPAVIAAATGKIASNVKRDLPKLAGLALNPVSVKGGTLNSMATVTLNHVSVGTPTAVVLKSSNPAAASVPTTVSVAVGASTVRDVTFYQWAADDEDDEPSEVRSPRR